MVRRAVWTAMMERYPELRYTSSEEESGRAFPESCRYALFNCMMDESTQTYLPEDYSFCRRWTQMGGEIWVDMRSRLDHFGTALFKGNAFSQEDPASRPAGPAAINPPGGIPP
jgi:hypothetical protein